MIRLRYRKKVTRMMTSQAEVGLRIGDANVKDPRTACSNAEAYYLCHSYYKKLFLTITVLGYTSGSFINSYGCFLRRLLREAVLLLVTSRSPSSSRPIRIGVLWYLDTITQDTTLLGVAMRSWGSLTDGRTAKNRQSLTTSKLLIHVVHPLLHSL